MGQGKKWANDELLVAMNLYCKLPFGQLHYRNPLIIEVANKLERTPSSLAMKLCNLASLDPRQQERGIKGLGSTSKGDKETWNLFNSDWERFGVESEEMLQALLSKDPSGDTALPANTIKSQKQTTINYPSNAPNGPTEKAMTVKTRIGQRFFRQSVLASYNCRCCITGNPIPELLVASHILPWGNYPEHRLNPRNGLCLAQTQDAAFDRGLITFDEDYRLVLGQYLKEHNSNEALKRNFFAYEGKPIQMPDKFLPDVGFLETHRKEVFCG